MWQANFTNFQATLGCTAFLDIIQRAQHDLSCFDLSAMTVSMIWLSRNKMRGGEDSYPLNRVSSMAFDSLQEFQQLHPTHSRIPRIAWSVHWHPPAPGLVKVNFDGAFFSRENIVGLGIIIQNDQGLVMTALS